MDGIEIEGREKKEEEEERKTKWRRWVHNRHYAHSVNSIRREEALSVRSMLAQVKCHFCLAESCR